MSLVVDASVAAKWVIEEDLSDQAVALLRTDEPLLAPELLLVELSNTLWKKVRRDEIGAEQARSIAARMEDGVLEFHSIRSLHVRALEIARDLDHPAYDCVYLACAERVGGTLITADRRLLNAVAGSELSGFARHLADPTPP